MMKGEKKQSNLKMRMLNIWSNDANSPIQPEPRRSNRERRISTRYPEEEYELIADTEEPQNYRQVLTNNDQEEWEKVMQDEIKSLHENYTYDLVELPKGKRALRCKWVFKFKTEENNPKPRYKARIVVKGCNQKKGVDFDEIFSPVVKMSSIRVVMGLAASLDLEIEQLDVKTALLHVDLDE